MGRADLHLHTTYSDGMGTVTAVLEAARRAELDIIAITDHDVLVGALQGRDLGPRYGVGVIPGCEITTAEGHLLAYWIERPVPPGRPLIETLLRVGEQGGLCVAAHPTAQWVHSLGAAPIRRALAHPDARRTLVGIEVYNMGLPRLVNNHGAQALGQETGLAQVANSDSHMLWTIGLCHSEFPGASPQALRQALEQHLTQPVIGHRSAGFVASWLKQSLVRLAGLGYWSAQPGAAITLRRLSAVQATESSSLPIMSTQTSTNAYYKYSK